MPEAEDSARSPLLPTKGGNGSNNNSASQVSAVAANGGSVQRSSTAQDLLKSSLAVAVWYTSNIG